MTNRNALKQIIRAISVVILASAWLPLVEGARITPCFSTLLNDQIWSHIESANCSHTDDLGTNSLLMSSDALTRNTIRNGLISPSDVSNNYTLAFNWTIQITDHETGTASYSWDDYLEMSNDTLLVLLRLNAIHLAAVDRASLGTPTHISTSFQDYWDDYQ